ncbi:MAG: hypothetical protein IKA44_05465 [Clostridia bacterium]|nr:hypothetical protein [Clostridia bacterium]
MKSTHTENHTLGQCKICGLPSDVYEICRQCQIKVNNGEIIKCPQCGNYHAKGYTCLCQQKQQEPEKEKPKETTSYSSTYVNVNQESEEQGCFGKAFGGTMGAGCGCVTFIIIAFIVAALAISGGLDAIFS